MALVEEEVEAMADVAVTAEKVATMLAHPEVTRKGWTSEAKGLVFGKVVWVSLTWTLVPGSAPRSMEWVAACAVPFSRLSTLHHWQL